MASWSTIAALNSSTIPAVRSQSINRRFRFALMCLAVIRQATDQITLRGTFLITRQAHRLRDTANRRLTRDYIPLRCIALVSGITPRYWLRGQFPAPIRLKSFSAYDILNNMSESLLTRSPRTTPISTALIPTAPRARSSWPTLWRSWESRRSWSTTWARFAKCWSLSKMTKADPEAAEGEHDDLVMGLAIAHQIRSQQKMVYERPKEEKERRTGSYDSFLKFGRD